MIGRRSKRNKGNVPRGRREHIRHRLRDARGENAWVEVRVVCRVRAKESGVGGSERVSAMMVRRSEMRRIWGLSYTYSSSCSGSQQNGAGKERGDQGTYTLLWTLY